jgi:murein DD-endopeptidase MepM/ murein hydrolase activator NlpD
MGVVRLFVCFFLFFVIPVGGAQESVHVVRRGDTIYSLARHYGVEVEALLTLNGIADPQRIREGQRLKIPPGSAVSAPSGGTAGQAPRYLEYRVVRGDSLYALARRYGATMEAIRQVNGLSADYVLKVGDRLRIPQAPALPAAGGGAATTPSSSAAAPVTTALPTTTALPPTAPPPPTTPRATAPAQVADAAVVWPIRAREVSYMTGKLYGVVLLGERSEPVKSLTQGMVVSAGPYRGFGRVVIVQMTGGYFYVYGGCESLSVKEGDRVAPGTELGKLGIDGMSSRPQLFFMVYRSNTPIDPARAPRS